MSRKRTSILLKYAFIFAAADIASMSPIFVVHLAQPEHSILTFAMLLMTPTIVVYVWWIFREAWTDRLKLRSFRVPIKTVLTLPILLLFSMPTAVRELYSTALVYGNTAVFLLCLFSRDLITFFKFSRWLSILFLTWILAAGVDLMARAAFSPIWVDFPNGVMLGYNLFFLFSAGAIVVTLVLFDPSSVPRPCLKFFLRVAVGSLVGYCLSVPLIYSVLLLIHG